MELWPKNSEFVNAIVYLKKIGLKNVGSTIIGNPTIMTEKYWKIERLEGKHTTLQIAYYLGTLIFRQF
jgi:hypothetical protein